MPAREKKIRYFNRELSWLEFNQRVFEEACDPRTTLLVRVKFLSIAASNLDEFFMVRVGGLHLTHKAGRRKKDPAGLTPLSQLRLMGERTQRMMQELHRCFNDVLTPALERAGIHHAAAGELTPEQERFVYALFVDEFLPVLTPMAIEGDASFPLLSNLKLHMLVRLRSTKRGQTEDRFAVLPLSSAAGRLVPLPSRTAFHYLLCEEIVRKHVGHWFPGYKVEECAVFRICRNADFAVREDEAPDLLAGMEDVLEARKSGDCVRLEVEADVSAIMLKWLCRRIPAKPDYVYRLSGPLNLGDFMKMASMDGFDELKPEAWPPQPSPQVSPDEPMFEQIAREDVLLYHPYESFDPVVRFIEEAAVDRDTLALKMVLYRTSSQSSIVAALKRAAENGINVTVLMEVKARFDEERNIDWARDLERGGVQVVYGVKGYKTHAKICLVVRREQSGVVRYCHFGTGNYHESTAKLYGDISYLTARPELGADASAFFNALCGYAQPQNFNRISMAPIHMRDQLLELIEFEMARATDGRPGRIEAKFNSLVDPALIDKLYEASQAGVEIRLNIRGICCLVPGVQGLSDNISVTSIVDRYLEHARLFCFHHGGKPQVFISSADWMPRNLDRRLELMIPIEDKTCRQRCIQILRTHLADTQSGWQLTAQGDYRRMRSRKGEGVRSQQVLYENAVEAIEARTQAPRTRFEPHRGER